MAMLPMAMYGLEVPSGDVAISARPDIPSAFRITMAAIDPSAEPEGDEGVVPRATLKVIRQSLLDDDEEDDSDFDQDEMERILAENYSDDSDDDEGVNGGPSDPAKSKKAKLDAAKKDVAKLLQKDGMDVDDEDDDEKPNGINGLVKSPKAKGKMPASDSDEDEDSEIDSEDEVGEIEEYVICTLDPSKLYQQPLDITFGEDERVWFKVSGTHSIFLTGNYVEPPNQTRGMFDPDSDGEEDYDLEPDDDELGESEDESIDELDDLEDPRVMEIEDEQEIAPALVAKVVAATKKGKRSAPDSADEDDAEVGAEGLDEMITKDAKSAVLPTVNGTSEQKLSKKQLKKLKKNDGAAAAAPVAEKASEKEEVAPPSSNNSNKKVSFAKDLEQGPTPTKDKAADKPAEQEKTKPALGVKTVQGVTIDDKKLGQGQAAKNGDRIGMRYIGKLKDNNKVFDSNTKGKPFAFKLGVGEVIKGWEVGVQGMQAGGERRITIPAHLAYGSKRQGEIPANSTLVFDIKMLDINKGK